MGEVLNLADHLAKKQAAEKQAATQSEMPMLRLPVTFNGQHGTLIVPAASWNALLRYSHSGPQWYVEFGPGELQWEDEGDGTV